MIQLDLSSVQGPFKRIGNSFCDCIFHASFESFLHCTWYWTAASNIWMLLIIRINPQTMDAVNTANVDSARLFSHAIFVNNIILIITCNICIYNVKATLI